MDYTTTAKNRKQHKLENEGWHNSTFHFRCITDTGTFHQCYSLVFNVKTLTFGIFGLKLFSLLLIDYLS